LFCIIICLAVLCFTPKQVFGHRTAKSQPIWIKFSTHLLLYGIHFFSSTRPGRTRGWLFTIYGSYNVFSLKNGPFWGCDNIGIHLGNIPKRGVNRQFQAKLAEYKNRDIVQSINTINVLFQEDVRTIKHKLRVVPYDVIPNPRWRTAAIFKIENKCSELGNRN